MDKRKKSNKKNMRAPAASKAKGRRSPISRSDKLTGVIQGSGRGFAFFIPADGGCDLFVAAKNLNGAVHGDTVEAVKISDRRGNGEAEVIKIVKRGFTEIVGVFDGKYVSCAERGFGDVKAEIGSGKTRCAGRQGSSLANKGFGSSQMPHH